jgi:hypothetical protein
MDIGIPLTVIWGNQHPSTPPASAYPEEITNLTITGSTLPSWLPQAVKLQALRILTSTPFSFPTPFRHFNLTEVVITNLSSLPDEIGRCRALRILKIGTLESGILPPSLARCKNLTILEVQRFKIGAIHLTVPPLSAIRLRESYGDAVPVMATAPPKPSSSTSRIPDKCDGIWEATISTDEFGSSDDETQKPTTSTKPPRKTLPRSQSCFAKLDEEEIPVTPAPHLTVSARGAPPRIVAEDESRVRRTTPIAIPTPREGDYPQEDFPNASRSAIGDMLAEHMRRRAQTEPDKTGSVPRKQITWQDT